MKRDLFITSSAAPYPQGPVQPLPGGAADESAGQTLGVSFMRGLNRLGCRLIFLFCCCFSLSLSLSVSLVVLECSSLSLFLSVLVLLSLLFFQRLCLCLAVLCIGSCYLQLQLKFFSYSCCNWSISQCQEDFRIRGMILLDLIVSLST